MTSLETSCSVDGYATVVWEPGKCDFNAERLRLISTVEIIDQEAIEAIPAAIERTMSRVQANTVQLRRINKRKYRLVVEADITDVRLLHPSQERQMKERQQALVISAVRVSAPKKAITPLSRVRSESPQFINHSGKLAKQRR